MTAAVAPFSSGSRFARIDAAAPAGAFAEDVRAGLTAPRKSLPPRWFYDELGSSLFDTICFLPEYYVMRAEAEILAARCEEMANAFGPRIRLIELGSGAARKTRILLDALTVRQPALEYVPVDVDGAMLERAGRELLHAYPQLRVTAIRGDFTRPADAIGALSGPRSRTVVLFLGSTIGNLDPEAAVAMLRELRTALRAGDALLLGADLKKERALLDAAYDDALGVTAAFNLNILGRINRELGGEFDLHSFRHRALWNEALGRVEMHLVSTRAQSVRVAALSRQIAFRENETIHTESSYKHDQTTLASLARESGFTIERTWTDARGWFADVLMVAR